MKIIKNLAISESGFIFNPLTGDSFSTNPIGLEIIQLIKEGKKNSDIIKHFTAEYDTKDNIVEKDLNDFISILKNHQLIESHD